MLNKKTLIFLTLMTLLLLLNSCKETGNSETTEEIETKEIETGDLFDEVLSGANTVDTDATEESEKQIEENSEETVDDQETDEENTEEDYADPECGDSICTYYETYSSCSEDCEKLEETTLYDYPDFLDDPIIVVGDDATSTDVITATVISTYLITHDITPETKLASEVTDFTSNDLILIGSPCENAVIAQLLHYDSDSCGVVTEMNNAVIKLLVFDSNEIIILTGYDNGDTRDASKMLTTDGTYNLNGAEEWVNLDSDGDITLYFSKN